MLLIGIPLKQHLQGHVCETDKLHPSRPDEDAYKATRGQFAFFTVSSHLFSQCALASFYTLRRGDEAATSFFDALYWVVKGQGLLHP